jgi:hypothetical protein
MNTAVLDIIELTDYQLKEQIEESVIAGLTERPALLKATGRQQRIVEAYYKTLAETDDEELALRAARQAAYNAR